VGHDRVLLSRTSKGFDHNGFCTKLFVSALIGLLAASTDVLLLASAQRDRPIVLAYYYGFYGDPSHGDWSQSRFRPELGPHRSEDKSVIRKHLEWAREAAIDGFIVSWWRPDSSSDRSSKLLFGEAENFGVKLAIMIERVVNRRTGQCWYVNVSFQDPNFVGGLYDTLRYVVENYVAAYPKTYLAFRGKPSIAFYAFLDTRKHDEEAYANLFGQIKNRVRQAPGQSANHEWQSNGQSHKSSSHGQCPILMAQEPHEIYG